VISLNKCLLFSEVLPSEISTDGRIFFAGKTSSEGQILNTISYQRIDASKSQLTYTSSDDFLSNLEIVDVTESCREIENGRAREFRDIEAFLRELAE